MGKGIKLRLSEKVEEKDLEVAKKMFLSSLEQFGYNESGLLDTSKLTQKVPVSKRGKLEFVLDIISKLCSNEAKEIPFGRIKEKIDEKTDMEYWELDNIIQQLKKGNQIYSPKRGYYSIL